MELGFTHDSLMKATLASTFGILKATAEGARYLCNKDPGTMQLAKSIIQLYPTSRFIWMIRDGRAVMHHSAKGRYPLHRMNSLVQEYKLIGSRVLL